MIELSGLTKRYADEVAVDSISFRVRPGAVTGFLGPNGAGKSTTIRVLLGMYHRDAGTVRVLGMDPRRDAGGITRATAYVPGDVALWPGLTGGQTLDALAGLRGARDRRREETLIEAFRLDPSKPVRSYSKGNRQKVMLVAALSAPCELLILDEPTSGLDPLQSEVFVAAVRHATGEGRTVLMSSHIMAEVDRLCDAVTIIKDGRTVESGPMAELRHLRASRITCTLPPGTILPLKPPGLLSRLREHIGGGDVTGGVAIDEHSPEALPQPDERGRFTASIPAERVSATVGVLVAAGARELTCSPVSLDEVFLEHYEAAAR